MLIEKHKTFAYGFFHSVVYLGALWCAMQFTAGCKAAPPSLQGRYGNYNILLVSIDTLRADFVGCYGRRQLTPAIDSLVGNSFLFESMFTTSSTTLPAHLSLMTSRYPRDSRNGYAVNDSVITLAEVLSQHGYTCLACVSALPLDKRFNIQQGFSYYDSDFSSCRGSMTLKNNRWFSHSYGVFDCNAEETTRRALSVLRSHKSDAPFFLWVHYYDPHLPYEPPPGYYDPEKVTRTDFPYYHNPTHADLDSLHELYSGEIRFVDAQLKKLLEGVGQHYNLDTTIIVIVSDHGENLYEHDGYLDHSRVVYDTVMWIPCLIYLPGVQGKRIGELASITDVMPTLLDLAGIPMEGGDGCSLVGLMEADSPTPIREYVTCETNDYGVQDDEQTIAVRTQSAKYIYNNWNSGKDLYLNMSEMPRERRFMTGADETKQRLGGYYREWRKQYKSGSLSVPQQLDQTTQEALKSLGYLQ